jgi:predicted  nucleic acid-binding Zn-ribbon protein
MQSTSGNLREELEKREKEIARLNARIAELERDLQRVRAEKEDEAAIFTDEKAKYEKKIKDLEEQIRMLRSESGDILQELEKKIQ